MRCLIGLCLSLAIILAASPLASANIRELRNKYLGGRGGGAAAAASAGPNGVSSSVAANAASAGFGAANQRYASQPPAYVGAPRAHPHPLQQRVAYEPAPVDYQRYAAAYPAARPVSPPTFYGEGGLIDVQQPRVHSPRYAPGPYAEPPTYGSRRAYGYPQAHGYQHQAGGRFVDRAQRVGRVYPPRRDEDDEFEGASSSSAASVTGGAGGGAAAAAAAGRGGSSSVASAASGHQQQHQHQRSHQAPAHNQHTVDLEELEEHYDEPESSSHYEASAGTYGDGANGVFEEGSYARDTESLEQHEDGHEDGDHYYNAHAYGRSADVNKHLAYNNDDEDVTHTPNLFRKKKSNTNFVSNFNKKHRETGSGVVAHDKHSASYNKNSKKLKENVDQRFSRTAEGSVTTKDFDSHADVDEEDEEAHDTRGLGTFVGVNGQLHAKRAQPNNPAAAAAAAASAAMKQQQAGH